MNKKNVNWNRNGVHTEVLVYEKDDLGEQRLSQVTGRIETFRGVAKFNLAAKAKPEKKNKNTDNIKQTGKNEKEMRGTVRLIGRDGYIMQMRGLDLEKRRKELQAVYDKKKARLPPEKQKGFTKAPPKTDDKIRHKEYAISRQIVVQSNEESVVFSRLMDTAKKLNAEFIRSVDLDRGTEDSVERSLRRLILNHEMAFLNSQKGKKETKNKKRRLLHALAGSSISDLDIEKIGTRELNKLAREHEKQAKEMLRMGQMFLQYCIQRRLYNDVNPFDDYILGNSGKERVKHTEDLVRRTTIPKSLGIVENRLKDMISAAPTRDVRYTALLMVMEFGCAATSLKNLRWRNIVFTDTSDGVQVQLLTMKENNAGSTHNYMRPGTRFAARELKRRYDELQYAFGNKLPDLLLVKRLAEADKGFKEMTVMQPGDITSFCKSALHECGIKNQMLQKDNMKEMGTGTRILLANYKDRLINRCGFGDGDASERFMMGASMRFDTTADNYRCFVDKEGQHHLQIMLNRDARNEPLNESGLINAMPWENEGQYIQAKSRDLSRFNHIGFEIELAAEDKFLVLADGGLELYIEDA